MEFRCKTSVTGLALVIWGFLLANGCNSQDGGATVLISRPQVFTREHLVQERFRETQWLLNQLNTDAQFTLQGSADNRVAEIFAQVISARLGLGSGPTKGTTYTTQPSVDSSGASLAVPVTTAPGATPTTLPAGVTSVQLFHDKLALRNAINDAIHETELDDTHDLNGYVLCNLQFDVTLLPGEREKRYAVVNALLTDGYTLTAEEKASKQKLASLEQTLTTRKTEWGVADSQKDTLTAAFAAVENLKQGKELSPQEEEVLEDAPFSWTASDTQSLKSAFKKQNSRRSDQQKLFRKWVEHVSEEILLAEIAAEIRAEQEGGIEYLVATIRPKINAEKEAQQKIAQAATSKSLKALNSSEIRFLPRSMPLDSPTDAQLQSVAENATKAVESLDKRLTAINDLRHATGSDQRASLTHLLMGNEVERNYRNALGEYLDFGNLDEISAQSRTYYVSTSIKPSARGEALFIAWLEGQRERPYVVSIQPKEYAQNIADFSQKSEAVNLALSLSAALSNAAVNSSTQYIKKSLMTLQAIQRKPLAIGFSEQANFGWLLGPKFDVANGRPEYSQVPVRQSFSVAVAVPAWWSDMTINTDWYWLSEDGHRAVSGSRQTLKGTTVTLPSRMDGLTAALISASQMGDTAVQFAPQIQSVVASRKADFTNPDIVPDPAGEGASPVYVQAGVSTSLMIRGRNLWRNPAVYLGGQKAASVEIHSDMKGISATFTNLQAPYDASAAAQKQAGDAQQNATAQVAAALRAQDALDSAESTVTTIDMDLSDAQTAQADAANKFGGALKDLRKWEAWLKNEPDSPPPLPPLAEQIEATTQPARTEPPIGPPPVSSSQPSIATRPAKEDKVGAADDPVVAYQMWWSGYVRAHPTAQGNYVKSHTNAVDAAEAFVKAASDVEIKKTKLKAAKQSVEVAKANLAKANSEKAKAEKNRDDKEAAAAKAKSSYSATTLTVVTTYGADSLSNTIAVVASGDTASSQKSGFSLATSSNVVTQNADGTATLQVVVKKAADSKSKGMTLSIRGADASVATVVDSSGKPAPDQSKFVTNVDGGVKVLDSCTITFTLKNIESLITISGDDGGLKIGPLMMERQGIKR